MGILLRRMDSPVGWAVAAGSFGLCFGLLPLSLPLVLFVPFGIGSFVMSFAAWSDIRRLVIRNDSNGGI